MSENMVVKVVVPASVWGELKGKAACAAVAEYVHKTLNLPVTDKTTKVYYGETEFWNVPASMVATGGTAHGGWNGGFATQLGYAINKRTKADVKAAAGTGNTHAASTNGNGDTKPRSTFKLAARFNLESAVIEFVIADEVEPVRFDAKAGVFTWVDPVAFSTGSKKAIGILSNPWESAKAATEIDGNGHMVKAGYAYGKFTSNETEAKLAGADILRQAATPANMDLAVIAVGVQLMNGELVEFTGEGVKAQFIEQYAPKPAAPATAPAAPSEQPSTVNAAASDEGLRVPEKQPEAAPARGKIVA